MNRLRNRNIYYIITGAPKAKYAERIIRELISEGARVFTIPTKAGLDFMDVEKLKLIQGNIVRDDWNNKIRLPKEDAVLIAPCTFNTLNSIAAGLANSYPLCLIASAVGKNIPIFIAPAMNKSLWDHDIIQETIKKLESWNCRVIWPQITPNKVTMIDVDKILDTLYFSFNRINYSSHQNRDRRLYNKLLSLRRKYFNDFNDIGKFLEVHNLNLPTAGCLSFKVQGGFIITSSGCDLSKLVLQNISFITSWDEKESRIEWVGDYMPSSEAPLHCIIRKYKNDNILLHSHCPKMTYSDKLIPYNTTKYNRYGTFKIGRAILKLLNQYRFCIMKYHGEVILSNNTAGIKRTLLKYFKIV